MYYSSVTGLRSVHTQIHISPCWRREEIQHSAIIYALIYLIINQNPFIYHQFSPLLNNLSILFSHPGHIARVSPTGTPLPHLPAPDLSCLFRHLRPDGSVCAGQRGCSCSDEAPGGQQQGGTAGGDGGEDGEGRNKGEGGGQPTSQYRVCGRRLGAKCGHTCPGNGKRVCFLFVHVWRGRGLR